MSTLSETCQIPFRANGVDNYFCVPIAGEDNDRLVCDRNNGAGSDDCILGK